MTDSGYVDQPSDSVFDVLVIGAGQSGLAIGRQLQQRGRSFLMVDAGPETGHVWRSRWDSLTLFTAARYSGLPGLPVPGDPDSYPTKDAVAQYLHHYATTFGLPIRHHTQVTRVTRDGAEFTVHTDGETFHAGPVVVATGPFQIPVIPAVAAAIGPDIAQLHSSAYRNPEQLPAGPVLVVGAANSGVQIAAELHRTRPVTIASGSATRSLPQRILGRDLFWWLTTTGLFAAPAQSRLGRRFRNSGELVIGTSTRRLANAGVTLHPRVTATDATTVTFADGTTTTPAAIVWATDTAPTTPYPTSPAPPMTPAHRSTSAGLAPSLACTSSASRGSTPGDRRCSASSAPTPHTSPSASRPHPLSIPCRLPDRRCAADPGDFTGATGTRADQD